ncbi:hypothetical protein SAMN05421751_102222 [Jhaorihella thermophila]|uniref:Uncharacterized protein n=1 Tax=Jhaorihella thermophila TaxID=488547 RepID=A0A1H5TFV9_9RHOB|nr:hypothetical protein SAMN05421751_102222 [Jhaorihella thermophila]
MTCCFFLVENTPGGVLEARFEDGGLAPLTLRATRPAE